MGCSDSKGIVAPLSKEEIKENVQPLRVDQRVKTQPMDKSLQVSTIPTNNETLIENASEAVMDKNRDETKIPMSPTSNLQKSEIIHRRNEVKKASTKKKQLSATKSNLYIARVPSQKSPTHSKPLEDSKLSLSPLTIKAHSGGQSQLDEPLQTARSVKQSPTKSSNLSTIGKFGPIIIQAGKYKKRVLSDQRMMKHWSSFRGAYRNSCPKNSLAETCRAPKDIRLQTLFKIYGFHPHR